MNMDFQLTPHLQQQIVSSIRSGGYAHIAAEAWGVPRPLFRRWLRLGRHKNAPEPYATFAAEVQSALAQARLTAEMNAFKKDPRVWLEHGPGKEKAGNPGWTGSVKATGDGSGPKGADGPAQPWLQAEFMEFCRRLLEVLLPFPEARRVAGQLLSELKEAKNNSL